MTTVAAIESGLSASGQLPSEARLTPPWASQVTFGDDTVADFFRHCVDRFGNRPNTYGEAPPNENLNRQQTYGPTPPNHERSRNVHFEVDAAAEETATRFDRDDTPCPYGNSQSQWAIDTNPRNGMQQNPFERPSGASHASVPSSMFSVRSANGNHTSGFDANAHSTELGAKVRPRPMPNMPTTGESRRRWEREARPETMEQPRRQYGTGNNYVGHQHARPPPQFQVYEDTGSNNVYADRPNQQRQPIVNRTYAISRVDDEGPPQGQYVFVPYQACSRAGNPPSLNDPGEFVFIPYDEPNAWKTIINTVNKPRIVRGRSSTPPIGEESEDGTDVPEQRLSTRPYRNTALPTQRLEAVPVFHWKISFSGDETKKDTTDLNINEFLYQVDIHKQSLHISDDEMLGQVVWLLSGTARTWYYAYFRNFSNWSTFIDLLRKRFLSPYYEQDALDEISKRVQKKNEAPLAYLNHMVMLFQTLPNVVEEGRMVHIIQRNLRPEFQPHVGPWEPKTLAQLERILSLLQTSKAVTPAEPERRPFFRRPSFRKVNEIENQEADDPGEYDFTEDEVLALMRETFFRRKKNGTDNRKDRSTPTAQSKPDAKLTTSTKPTDGACFNCGQKGHGFRVCPEPRKGLFCYLCGAEGKKTFDCECSKNGAACLENETEQSAEAPDSQ